MPYFKSYLKDLENILPTQKFTFTIRKFFIVSKVKLSLFKKPYTFSHWYNFILSLAFI